MKTECTEFVSYMSISLQACAYTWHLRGLSYYMEIEDWAYDHIASWALQLQWSGSSRYYHLADLVCTSPSAGWEEFLWIYMCIVISFEYGYLSGGVSLECSSTFTWSLQFQPEVGRQLTMKWVVRLKIPLK